MLKQIADQVELKWSTDRRVTRNASAEPNVSYIHMLDVFCSMFSVCIISPNPRAVAVCTGCTQVNEVGACK
jgi:hypothetical protein